MLLISVICIGYLSGSLIFDRKDRGGKRDKDDIRLKHPRLNEVLYVWH